MASFSSRIAIYQTIGCVLLDHAMPLKDIVVYHASWRTIPLYIIPVRVAFGIVLAVVAARLQQSTQRALASAGVSVASSLAIILPGHNISAVWIVWSLVLMFTVAYLYYLDDFGAMKKDLEAVLDGDEDEYLRFAREEILLVMNLSTKVLVTIFSIGVGFVVSALWRGWAPTTARSLWRSQRSSSSSTCCLVSRSGRTCQPSDCCESRGSGSRKKRGPRCRVGRTCTRFARGVGANGADRPSPQEERAHA